MVASAAVGASTEESHCLTTKARLGTVLGNSMEPAVDHRGPGVEFAAAAAKPGWTLISRRKIICAESVELLTVAGDYHATTKLSRTKPGKRPIGASCMGSQRRQRKRPRPLPGIATGLDRLASTSEDFQGSSTLIGNSRWY